MPNAGWTFRRKGGVSVWREGEVSILGVPYSEHSSWSEWVIPLNLVLPFWTSNLWQVVETDLQCTVT